MSKYEKGNKTKESIISACRKLFYCKGYNDTTIADISELSGVNQGSIYYHFKKTKQNIKSMLGMILYIEIVNKCYDEARKYTESDGYLFFALGNYFFWYKFFKDDRYRRFVSVACKEVFIDNPNEFSELYYKPFDFIKENIQEDLIKNELNIIAQIGIDVKLIEYIGQNIQNFSYEYVTEYILSLSSRILEIDKELTNQKLVEAKNILNNVNLDKLDCTFSLCH